MTDVIQAFLTKRLFDVGGDDGRVKPLREAASDVAALIKAAPQRTATLTMIAIDSAVDRDEPVVLEVMKLLEKRWQSYAGAFSDTSLPTVARAILLEGLSASSGMDSVAAAISLTARNMLPRLGDRIDQDLWLDLVTEADRRLGRRSEREWALPSASAASEISLSFADAPKLEHPSLNKTWLQGRLEGASGPQNPAGEATQNPNPHWPNEGSAWSYQFAPRAAAGIAASVDAVVKSLVEKLTERQDFEGVRTAIADYVSRSASALTQTAVGLERRSALLWWKEALYSPSAGVSYRTLTPSGAAALAAMDGSSQAGAFSPRMTEAVIWETLRSIDNISMADDITLTEHLTAVATVAGEAGPALQKGYGVIHSEPGRTPLGALVASGEPFDPSVCLGRLGVDGTTRLSAMDFGVWLFRDLQAAAATPEPTKRKRGARSS